MESKVDYDEDLSTIESITSADMSFQTARKKFFSSKLQGRDKEIQKLKGCLQKIVDSSTTAPTDPVSDNKKIPQRAFVLIKGESGTGKTALAKTLKQEIQSGDNGLFVSGKYELYLRDEPYYGIVAACRAICGEILLLRNINTPITPIDETEEFENEELELDVGTATVIVTSQESPKIVENKTGRSFEEIQDLLLDTLGQNILILMSLIPEMEEVISFDILEKRGLQRLEEVTFGNQQENKARLHQVFRLFLRFITKHFGPLIMVLDDLQWADVGSLELMDVIMCDDLNPNFMLIGLYRSNEVGESHLLTSKILSLKELSEKDEGGYFSFDEIEVGNLEFEAVKNVTMDLLALEDNSRVSELATLLHYRTQGNVFFLISFIMVLLEVKLIEMDRNVGKYEWDIDAIKSETVASDNVVNLMKRKMSKLSKEMGILLSVAACLGASFDLKKLEMVWSELEKDTPKETRDQQYVSDMIAMAIHEGFIEREGGWNTFRWIHDKVQEAAFALIPADVTGVFQVRIGTILYNQMSPTELESSLTLVVNLLNETPPESLKSAEQQFRLSQLNLRAAIKSTSCSAFSSAAFYARKGISFLPDDSWRRHYKLTLELYSYAAEAAVVLGKDVEMREYCNAILSRPNIPMTDQFRANLVLTGYLMGKYQEPEAIVVLLEVLKKFGFKFPKRKAAITLSVVKNLLKVKMIVKNYTLEKALSVPMMKDQKHIQVMRYLDKLSVSSYLCSDPICPIAILRAFMVTAKHGLCDMTPVFFTTVGLLFIATGDFKGADALGDYSLVLLKRLPRDPVSRTKFSVGLFIYGWTRKYSEVCTILLEAYQSGLSTGDIESAMFAITVYNLLNYVSGRRLDLVWEDCKAYASQASKQKRDVVVDFLSIPAQMALNLMGLSDNTTVLEGQMIPNLEAFWERSESNSSSSGFFWNCTQRLCLVFNDYKHGADTFVAHCDYWQDKLPAHALFQDFVFTGGMCCFEMVKRKAPNRKFKQFADKAFALIKEWCSKGSYNVQHYRVIFAAQKAIIKKKFDEAEKLFKKAISMSLKGGFIHDAAIANESYGMFILSSGGDYRVAKQRLQTAIELYIQWGADKKVDLLSEFVERKCSSKKSSIYDA